jgi:hypothetical protein
MNVNSLINTTKYLHQFYFYIQKLLYLCRRKLFSSHLEEDKQLKDCQAIRHKLPKTGASCFGFFVLFSTVPQNLPKPRRKKQKADDIIKPLKSAGNA